MKQLTYRCRLYLLYSLYVILDVLTGITNANSLLVRKKIQIGAAIISLTLVLNSCSSANKKEHGKESKKDVAETTTSCYLPAMPITDLPKTEKDTLSKKAKPHVPKLKSNPGDSIIEIVSCYDAAVEPIEMIPDEEIKDDTLTFAEQMPSFQGGLDSMNRFIYSNLRYPKELTDIDVVGMVILQFTVTHQGDIEHIKVLRSLYPPCDTEAIKVIKLMPKWIPGKHGGIERNVRYTLPVRFNFE